MSEWIETTLGEVLDEVDVRNSDGAIDLVLSVTEGRGIVPQAEVFKKRIATEDVTNYKVLEPGDIAWNPYLLWKGAIGQWLGGCLGVTSPIYPVFRAKPGQDGRFWGLVLTSGLLTPYFDSTAVGSIERRRRTTLPVFRAAPVLAPPLAEQRRIVDVMSAVDAQIEALEAEAERGHGLLPALVQSLAGSDDAWPRKRLGEVGEFIRGKRFTKAEYVDEGIGVIHYSHIHTHYGPLARKVVARVDESARGRLRFASPGDVVVAATSEDLEGVAKATAWLGDEDVAVHDDAQIFRHTLDPRFAAFTFLSPEFQAQKVQYVAGTKVTRISGADLAKIEVPIPPEDVQRAIGDALEGVVEHLESTEAELDRLRVFRSSLLTALLDREIEIPESYDALLEEAS